MAHYAFLDSNGVVTQVIVGKDEGEDGVDWEQYYGQIKGQTCKRTSYNTRANAHATNGSPFRKNYAGIGYVYDSVKDAFIPPKPYPSWILDEETCTWEAPIKRPEDGEVYYWEEETNSWKSVNGR